MRPRASQVARIRLVDTEEDVETYRPAPDAIKAAIGDRQAELAMLEGEPAIVGGKTPLALSGGRWREQGVGSISTYPLVKLFIIRHLHIRVGVGRGRNGGDNPLT